MKNKTHRLILKIFNKSSLFFSVILLIFILPIVLNFTYFETNDDFGMMLISEGNFSGIPETDLIYPSINIGYILKFLYTIAPNISWYPILQLIINFTSFYLFLIFIKDKIKNFLDRKIKFLVICIFVIIPWSLYFSFFYSYQFTVTAIIATGIGFIIFACGPSKLYYMSIILILLGLAWRPIAGLAILALLSLIFISNSLIYSKNINSILKPKKIIILISIIVFQLSANYYSSIVREKYSESFYNFNLIRGNLHGYQPTETEAISKKMAKKTVGWSPNDYELFFNHFFYGDTDIYSMSHLKSLSELKDTEKNLDFYVSALKKVLKTLYQEYLNHFLLLIMLSLIIFFLSPSNIKKRLGIIVSGNFFLFFLYLYIVNLQGRLPGRVVLPSLIVFAMSVSLPLLTNLETSRIVKFQSNFDNYNAILTRQIHKLEKFIKRNFFLVISIFVSCLLYFYFMFNFSVLALLPFFIAFLLTWLIYLIKNFSSNILLDSSILLVIILITFSLATINKNEYSNIKSRIDFRHNDPVRYQSVINYSYEKPIIAFSSFYSPLMNQNPFHNPNKRLFFINVIHIGSSLYSISSQKQLINLNLSKEILLEVSNQNAYLGVGANIELQMVSQFILEHYELKIEWPPSPFSYTDNGIQVWNIANSKEIN